MKNLFALLLLVSGMLICGTTKAQGNFIFTNNTTQSLDVTVVAIHDDCVTNVCYDGPVTIAAGNSHTFSGCTSGAWKDIFIRDACRRHQVGICLSSTTSSTVVLCSGNYTLTYMDEHNGKIQ